ncbi:MAG: hypothetical protein ACRD6X_21470 [Pyrinomonadaceae bacterium]
MKRPNLLILLFCFALFAGYSHAQKRDYLTEAEIEIVRNNQDVDLRIAVLARMVDRRFAVIGIQTGGKKPSGKSSDEWGEEPKGTRLEILTDIRQLIEKAIDDIDTLVGRLPEKMKEQRKGESIFNKAVRSLAGSANRWLSLLKKEFDAAEIAKDEKIYSITAASIEFCEQIIDASSRIK